MKIVVRLFASLRTGRFVEEARDVNADATVNDVLRELNIGEDAWTLIFVNGRHARPDTRLAEGDTVALFPPIGGG